VIPSLIHKDQKGFVRGRSIHHHIAMLRDLQHKHTVDEEEGFATFLDFEKAYDRVNWRYLFEVMESLDLHSWRGCGC